jgi:hypothetical protein
VPFGRVSLRHSESRIQKLANPSSGLEADAYRRRGMRPAS